jgi:hypothetical protein
VDPNTSWESYSSPKPRLLNPGGFTLVFFSGEEVNIQTLSILQADFSIAN